MPDRPSALRGQPRPPGDPPPRLAPDLPFPDYRHTPGLTPHPRHDPKGHSHGQAEAKPTLIDPSHWRECRDYLHAIDLYNNAYWWECHECLEGLWIAAGRSGVQARFFQAIIQAAAANLKWHLENHSAARFLAEEACRKLSEVLDSVRPSLTYMGLDVPGFIEALRIFHVSGGAEGGDYPPLIGLDR